jgi:hypothetical protein
MTDPDLFNRALALCIKCNSHAIAHDLAYFNEAELMGVINFLSQFVRAS